jgi:hypothetical protein
MPFDITSTTTSPDPRYLRGPMKIWYMRPSFFRNGLMGFDWLKENDLLPLPNYVGNVERTHVCIGSISVDDPEDAYELMQGERWSPHGEARPLIEAHGLKHTSMSMGDIVQKDNAFWIVDSVGFKRLANLDS